MGARFWRFRACHRLFGNRLFGSYLFTTQHTSGGVPALGAAKVLIATFTLIGGGVEPRQNLAANAFSRRRSPLAILFSARYGFSPGLLPKCRQAFADPSSEKSKKWTPHYAGESRTARNRPVSPRQMLRWPYHSSDLQAPLKQRTRSISVSIVNLTPFHLESEVNTERSQIPRSLPRRDKPQSPH